MAAQGDIESVAAKTPKELTTLFEHISGSEAFRADYNRLASEKDVCCGGLPGPTMSPSVLLGGTGHGSTFSTRTVHSVCVPGCACKCCDRGCMRTWASLCTAQCEAMLQASCPLSNYASGRPSRAARVHQAPGLRSQLKLPINHP